MADYYLDSSALMKRYKSEIGSEVVAELFANAGTGSLFTAQFSILEVSSVADRLRRGRLISNRAYDRAMAQLAIDAAIRLDLVMLSQSLGQQALSHTSRHGLTAGDALQLAAALAARSENEFSFVSSDKRLIAAAMAEGLTVLDPEPSV